MLIFVSYTLRDGVLSKESLTSLRGELSTYADTYVDILDNKAPDPQAHVLAMLQKADVLLVCETRGFYMSKWTQLELAVAKQRNIPIFRVTAEQLRKERSAYMEVSRDSKATALT
jgi:hypothetical protein